MTVESALKNLDNPIQSFEENLLQRRGFVESLCRIFDTASPDESTVFALYDKRMALVGQLKPPPHSV